VLGGSVFWNVLLCRRIPSSLLGILGSAVKLAHVLAIFRFQLYFSSFQNFFPIFYLINRSFRLYCPFFGFFLILDTYDV